ncbi:supervillin-like isoform X2 [Polistes fuscatus]|uniref:supervillin-like isoform X2 n=1 Tax=Polistes fuscatus TaxID=30207 RepID=UPI001CA8792C|nr:supervillin-like isoform X2 [Polistes fuscatus]
MVAAGATVLMAASGESSLNETENNSSECVNATDPSKCNNIQCNEQNTECRPRKNLIPCSSDKDKKHGYALGKSNRATQRVENKDQHKNLALHKVAHIRETKASRLRAASIVSSNSNTLKRPAVSETAIPSGSQLSVNLSTKVDNPVSSDNGNTMNPVRERDKSYKRKSYLNRSSNIEAVPSDRLINTECNERRSTRQSSKQNHISDTILSSDTGASHQTAASPQKKHTESKLGSSRGNIHNNTHRSKPNFSSSTVTSLPNTKCCNVLQNSKDGHSDSEVSRRVDALTALTKATMERVERLASHSGLSVNHKQKSEIYLTNVSPTRNVTKCANHSANHSANIHTTVSPSKCSILKKSTDEYPQDSCSGRQPPVSILKHKVAESETGQSSSNTSHNTLPVTFSPSVIEPIHKRHGILKKRSSLDESEILRRRSYSPDVSFNDNNYSEFRPILKNQRRSSLDEIIKRDQSPDPQPTSILKRKTSREDDREDGQIGSPEPQGILKRKSMNNTRSSNTTHHVTIATDLTNGTETFEGSEVRPILKKKHSREESSGNDPPSHEPRPILKKKSSTESDEHDDKPKKTILKCSRKSSQDECNYDMDITSPKKLSMLKNRVLQSRSSGLLESDCVKPILKQSTSRENEARVRLHIHDTNVLSDLSVTGNNLFLRKRAQSVGHVQPSNISNELAVVRDKRRSLESNSLCDMLLNQSYLKSISGNNLRSHLSQSNESSITTMTCRDSIDSVTADEKLNKENKDKRLVLKKEIPSEQKSESHEFVTNKNCEKNINFYTQMSSSKKAEVNLNPSVNESKKDLEASNIEEKYIAQHSSSVSAMALHFKNMEESVTSKEKSASSNVQHKVSHGIQHYRDRKLQGNDRFNTQPVTLQEVQEAVLQNQRNAASNNEISNIKAESTYTPDDEYDPSKLSLAERVRLFNQKIIAETSSSSNKAIQERFLRRRPGARYKTQPITSEEVEVASRISPLNTVEKLSLTKDIFEESQNANNNAQLSSGSQTELPKSILKSSAYHSNNTFRTKSPELEGLKLIKSVLKKESEELQQQVSNTCDIIPRFNLKTNPLTSSDKCDSNCNNQETNNDDTFLQSKNINVKQHQYGEKEDITSKDFYHIRKVEKHDDKESIHSETKQEHTVPCLTKIISQDKSCKSRTNFNLDEVDIIKKGNVMSQRYNSDDKHLTKNEIPQSSDDDTSSSGSREVRGIIKNEAIFRRRQNALAKQAKHNATLSKSASHHALSSEGASFDITKEKCNATTILPGLYRSATQTISVSDGVSEADGPSMSIADRLAALQRSGNTNWKRRIMSETSDVVNSTTFNKEELTIRQGVLADCLGKLESAAEGWKKRIAAPDAIKFTVAGKMKVEKTEILEESSSSLRIEVTNNIADKKKRPRPERFKGRKDTKDVLSTPSSPSKDSPITIRRSFSEPASDESGEENKTKSTVLATVSVPKVDDETFTSFYTGVSLKKCETECFSLDENAFDVITSNSELLGQKRSIQTQKRRAASKNPIKLLASRTDLKTEYTEVSTGIAEKVMRSLNVEKLAKNSALAIEALAGLASTEDFSAITLRNIADANNTINKLRPYKDLMLIMVKGRRHVQARLVEPVANSINSGDTYVLVTKSEVYNYVGKYSNVIEKARAAEIALSIQQNKDLGCQASHVITINEDKITCTRSQMKQFWNYLGIDTDIDVIDGGHPDEDELYESAIINTNMIYEVKDDELVPLEKYWGAIPKIKMLDLNKILVFDFGSEMYIWTGKRASNNKKKVATRLATELWKEGYDYTECAISPINAASMIGRRNKLLTDIKSEKTRPSWCLFAKLAQHVETVLFREKFLDWPNVAGIIKMKVIKDKDQIDGTIIVEPCNLDVIIEPNNTPVDLNIKGCHLGRGTGWYDDELMKQCTVETTSINVWHIDEFSHTLLDNLSNGQFYTGDSYIIRWMYSVTITGRELSGLQSKHFAKGRDRSVYFIWQGKNASLNEQGAAALLTVELDNEQGPQIRVVQGHEPAAFLNLFSGEMVIHMGKKADKKCDQRWRLYICRGTLESEIFLTEIPCSTRQLRSRGSFILLDIKFAKIYVWHGTNALPHIKKNALFAANKIKDKRLEEFGLTFEEIRLEILEINEGVEPEEFFNALGGMNKTLYISFKKDPIQDHTPRLFHFSSITKEFKVTEILCPHRAHLPTPFPFLQDELYQVNQPALFLLDNKNEVWIWQGWWPDSEAEDHSGSKAVRWQAERKTTMTMAIQYWESIHPNVTKFPIYLVWAGLEPLQFINLFPTWTYRDDIAELNMQEGRNPGEILNVESELARLTQSTYPPAQLLQRPLPVGVDPTRLELYLSQQHFQELLGISKEEFQELPMWKQVNLKKEVGLF